MAAGGESIQGDRRTVVGRQRLAHVDSEPAHEGLLAVHGETVVQVQVDVRCKLLVGEEPQALELLPPCDLLRMLQENARAAAALECGCDR
ncbi:hypothetical protein ASE28_27820 [Acidovorax sp. Root219]|nr:hypothetical protein ASE28_27820 [Acidovorax sp. Root219]